MNIKTFKGNNKEGKNILIISGVHGDEITPIFCTKLLQEHLVDYNSNYDVNNITIISAVNKIGIKNNTRDITKKQSNDLNRLFNSDIQEDYVAILKTYIDEHDVIIDIHSSPNCTEFLLINQDFYANSYVDFCIKNDIKYFLRYSNSDTIKKYCSNLNKISFTLELNGMDRVDDHSTIKGYEIVKTIISNINGLNIIKEEPKYNIGTEIYTLHSGLNEYFFDTSKIIDVRVEFNAVTNIETFEQNVEKFDPKGNKYNIICYSERSYVEAGSSIASVQEIQEIF